MNLEVSLGEAIDKLTILDIKCKCIKDNNKLVHVKKEYDYLKDKLDIYLNKYPGYYKMLVDVNKMIWNLQDEIRDKLVTIEYAMICSDIINLNDARFRVKNKLNYATESKFREQKGYKHRECIVISLEKQDSMIDVVKYLSMFYDSVLVFCKENDISVYEDINIKIMSLPKDNIKETYPEADIFYGKLDTFENKITHPYLSTKYVHNNIKK